MMWDVMPGGLYSLRADGFLCVCVCVGTVKHQNVFHSTLQPPPDSG